MRRKQADLRFKKETEVGAPWRLERSATTDSGTPLGKAQHRRPVGQHRKLAGTHRHCLHDHFKQLFTDPLRWETTGMAMAAMATGGATIPSAHRQPEGDPR